MLSRSDRAWPSALFRLFGAIAAVIALSQGSAVNAADISSHVISGGRTKIRFVGEIVEGDAAVLKMHIDRAAAAGNAVSTIELNSIGGNLYEGTAIARMIRAKSLGASVASGADCVSACFLALAAGSSKSIGAGAQVGVHAASSEFGDETQASVSATATMGRIAGILGVPLSIIKAMIETPADNVFWLNNSDLASMGAFFPDS